MIGASVRDDTPYIISVTMELLVRLLSIPDPLALDSDPPDEKNDPDVIDIMAEVDAAEDTHCFEDIPAFIVSARPLQIAALAVSRTKQPVNVGATLVSASIIC